MFFSREWQLEKELISNLIYLITLTILAAIGIQSNLIGQESNELFTIYLVRHSEKDLKSNTPSDPPLTPCGEKRAEYLCNFLSDVNLDNIYSTKAKRTKSTALPTANFKELKIEEYNQQELEDFAERLISLKQDALVVGHSTTTGILAGLLVGEEIGEFALDIYDRIYQVVISGKNGRLHLLHSSFVCNE